VYYDRILDKIWDECALKKKKGDELWPSMISTWGSKELSIGRHSTLFVDTWLESNGTELPSFSEDDIQHLEKKIESSGDDSFPYSRALKMKSWKWEELSDRDKADLMDRVIHWLSLEGKNSTRYLFISSYPKKMRKSL
jgi:hypothetical protein